jgi:ankyrin repeat protein/beta-lactamase regulating signal transducer with metallopeptidase domain
MTSTIAETALALSRWAELSIIGKATLMLLIGLTATWVAKRARASVRHLLMAATFATLLALPLIVLVGPVVTIELPVSYADESNTVSALVPPSDTLMTPNSGSPTHRTQQTGRWSAPSWTAMARGAWIAGAMLLLVSLALDFWRLRRIRRDGLPWPELREPMQALAAECGVRRSVEFLLHEDIPAPLTCGVWQPAIVLPSDTHQWKAADLRRALGHEFEHVRRADWAIQLAARAICACYWFHPLVWVAWRKLRLEAERACDDAAIQSAERTEYAEQLVSLARRMSKAQVQPALGMANRSDLSTRVSALLDDGQQRGRAGLLATASAISIASLVVLTIAPVRTVAQSRNPASATTPETRSLSLDRTLFEVAEDGNISVIDALLNAGANVNCSLESDGSPLIAAARNGHLAAVRLLLDRGADPNMPVRGDGNPLIMAAREGNSEIVTLLLDRGASINQMVPEDENALVQASGSGHLHVVKVLITRGADTNARAWTNSNGGEWRTPLSMARRGGHDAVVALLLASGARE